MTHTNENGRAPEGDTAVSIAPAGSIRVGDTREDSAARMLPPLTSIEATQLGLVRMYGFLGAYMARYPKERRAEDVVRVVHTCENCGRFSHPIVEFARGADPVVRLLDDNCDDCGASLDRYDTIADLIDTATRLRLDIQRGCI